MEDISKELEAIKSIVETINGIDEDRRMHVIKYVVGALKIQDVKSSKDLLDEESLNFEEMTISEFIQAKKPQNNYQLIAVLGYYLEKIKKVKEFGAKEIREANSEARLPPISNITRDIQNTQRQYNFIIPSSNDKNKKTLSTAGINVVEALPDHEKARSIMKSARPRFKKKGTSNPSDNNEDQ